MSRNADEQLKFQRILVTGGAGFIGSHLIDALVSRGCKPTIFDNLSRGKLENIALHLKNGQAHLVKGDVRDLGETEQALIDVDTVFHLAAITSVPYSLEHPRITKDVNAKGTRNLLEACTKNDTKRFIYVSTCAVYGEPQYLPIDEDHQLNPKSPYAECKMIGKEYCKEFMDRHGLKTATLRLFNVYGPRQGENEYGGVITRFIKSAREGRPPTIYGDGRQTRDFVHVNDVVQALLLSATVDNAVGQTFNIGSGKSVSINEVCRLVLKALGVGIQPVYTAPRPGDINHSCADIKKARRILGYEPKVPLEKGLEELISHHA